MLEIAVPLILCIDSKFLYDCQDKLRTTQEKQLMVDEMSLRLLYKQQEIIEVKWIYGHQNLADFMTQAKS